MPFCHWLRTSPVSNVNLIILNKRSVQYSLRKTAAGILSQPLAFRSLALYTEYFTFHTVMGELSEVQSNFGKILLSEL